MAQWLSRYRVVIRLHFNHLYTVSQKKRANFETVYLEIIRIDFDDIWQKYSSKSILIVSSYTVSKFVRFFLRHSVDFFHYQLFRFLHDNPGRVVRMHSPSTNGVNKRTAVTCYRVLSLHNVVRLVLVQA